MYSLPTIAPMSDMRIRQAEIVEKAKAGPVVLVERGSKPALVVVSPELWNNLTERLEYLEDAVAIYKKKRELATGQDEMVEVTPETLAEWMGVEKLPPASRLQLVQQVLHSLLPTMVGEQSPLLRFGEFSGDEANMSTEEDFAMTEWHPTDEELDGP
jgi:prevent-host-death family protein